MSIPHLSRTSFEEILRSGLAIIADSTQGTEPFHTIILGASMLISSANLTHWVTMAGYFGILLIIFIETGLFFGFFLPGDSLLFTTGFLASQNVFNIWYLIPLMIITAILGYQFGYYFGKVLGGWLLKRPDSFWFKRRHLEQARNFYDKHGNTALIVGRLIPVVRTLLPIVAGMVQMSQRRYLVLNFMGALLWAGGMTILGYLLGNTVPKADHYILPAVFGIIFISLIPGLLRYFHKRR